VHCREEGSHPKEIRHCWPQTGTSASSPARHSPGARSSRSSPSEAAKCRPTPVIDWICRRCDLPRCAVPAALVAASTTPRLRLAPPLAFSNRPPPPIAHCFVRPLSCTYDHRASILPVLPLRAHSLLRFTRRRAVRHPPPRGLPMERLPAHIPHVVCRFSRT
jgi:hypothetical protein